MNINIEEQGPQNLTLRMFREACFELLNEPLTLALCCCHLGNYKLVLKLIGYSSKQIVWYVAVEQSNYH